MIPVITPKIHLVPKKLEPGHIPVLGYYWESLQLHGAVKRRFPHGDVKTFQDFIAVCTHPNNFVFLVFNESTKLPCGEFMLTDFSGQAAHVHFSLHPDYYRQGVEIARSAIRQVFALRRGDGLTPLVFSLIGLTAVTNRLARKFNHKVGFIDLAIVPKGCYIHPEIYVDGAVTLLTADMLDAAIRRVA